MNPTALFKRWQNVSGVKFPEDAAEQFRGKKDGNPAAPMKSTTTDEAPDPAIWITAAEAAEAVGVSRSALLKYCARHNLPFLRYQGADKHIRNYFRRRDIDNIIASRKAPAGVAKTAKTSQP